MSSKDDPSTPAGKTVIRATPRRERKPAPAPEVPVADGGSRTVFDPGIGRHTPPGWTSGTVIYQASVPAGGGASATTPTPALRQEALFNLTDNVRYCAENPILAAAAPLLMLFGQFRLVPVERQADPLAEHVAEAIDKFDRVLEKSCAAEEDARIAKFVLCETADDLIGNLPWPRKDAWAQHSMLSQFFHVEPNGTGFFEALNKILASPEAHYDLLELMHVCLSLGYEGQYRGLIRDDTSLERVRRDVYETLRYFRPRAAEDISPRWQGLAATVAQSSTRLPLWVVAAAASALLTAAFFALRIFITNEGDAAAGELLALNPSTPIAIERASVAPLAEPVKVAPPQATTTQIDRIRSALAKDVEGGGLAISTKGNFIVVEINNLLLFQSGKADAKPEFQPIAADIAAALEAERGPIRIVGHTDNVKPRKSSPFKSNFDLSVARAKAVETMMAAKFSDPSRLTVDGKGEDEPIADNATAEGRAKNRRVDVMIAREETL
ncbi:type VI secretion system protein TssL, long form [Mesorhizobium erdmanii]|uniref:type VI secretion system protein TssL, long form n=1 Tax=Mesorhizobium erdmanii TaxID=1777866 RepID=UPI00047D8B23|nr:type VI secretion system protein TssL, long form [Mesorhizobium erdmanii]